MIFIGIVFGTVFTFGMRYWEGHVTKNDVVRVEAAFSSYKATYRRLHLREMIVYFENHEQLYIDGSCLTDSLVDRVKAIEPGTVLQLYVHPHSHTILEMLDNGEVIMRFDESTAKLSSEVSAFTVLGILMYLSAAFGVLTLSRKR